MRVRLQTLYAGPLGCFQPGDCVELSNEAAAPLVAGGFAVRLDAPASIENTAINPPRETATAATPRGRRKASVP